ncbi:MAG: hypothetical protein IKE52_00200 [Mogibacterium sp.]|nr:hypothetical protein [Mogibacterium sp.]
MTTRYKVLDSDAFSDFLSEASKAIEEGFESQDELSYFITNWADNKSLEYKVDKGGNIIFDSPAIERKKSVSPTVIVLGLNYKTISDKASLLASAIMLASSDLESGRKTIIFANNEDGSGKGYSALSKKYISDKAKVIYLDQGKESYLSNYSFAMSASEISMPLSKEKASLDTAVKIHISGIRNAEISPENYSNQPNPILALSPLLTRLKSKSAEYRVADISVQSGGNMYPSTLDVCIMLNSYSLDSFTKYIDSQIKIWEKKYLKSNPDFVYSYEIIEADENLPAECYDADSGDLLTRLLYTVNSGVYKFSQSDPIPEDRKEGDIYGVNCITSLEEKGSAIKLRLLSQGYNNMFLERIIIDNQASAELLGCSFVKKESSDAFENNRESLYETLISTYYEVEGSSDAPGLTSGFDSSFTPCSYLAEKNGKADILHLRISKKSASNITNTIMYYIKSKGSTFYL